MNHYKLTIQSLEITVMVTSLAQDYVNGRVTEQPPELQPVVPPTSPA